MERTVEDGSELQLDELQKRIGYVFGNTALLRQAITHKSYANEIEGENSMGNERLEFLGDAVLELAVTHLLMERFPDYPEGRLSQLRAAIVNKESIASVASKYDLGSFLLLGRGEDASRGRAKKSILANIYEAIVAAVYYDGGFPGAFAFIKRHFAELIVEGHEQGVLRDYKSRLQEYSQSELGGVPDYEIVGAEGPDHDKLFEVHVTINGIRYETGRGRNKKSAEQEAARKTLQQLIGEESV
jgi:ribonuclease III